MQKSYPLYEELLNLSLQDKTRPINTSLMSTAINNISTKLGREEGKDHFEEIYALIFHHFTMSGVSSNMSIPYTGKLMTGGRGVLYEINKLPPNLCHIIWLYTEKYLL